MKRIGPAIALVLAACGAEPSKPDPLAAYPTSRFMIAEGHGTTALAAADDARTRLSAQISARLTARLTVDSTQSAAGGHDRIEHRIITETSFGNAELIEIPRDLTRCVGQDCRATAVLSRMDAIAALTDEVADPAARFEAAWRAAGHAAPDAWRSFTTALRTAESAFAERAALGWQQAVISGRTPTDFEVDRARYGALQTERAARLSTARVALGPTSGLDGDWAARANEATKSGFAALGLAVVQDGSVDLTATLSGAHRCDRGPLGPRCVIELTIEVAPPGGELLVRIEPGPIAAVDPRSASRADRRLAERLADGRLATALADALYETLPIASRTP